MAGEQRAAKQPRLDAVVAAANVIIQLESSEGVQAGALRPPSSLFAVPFQHQPLPRATHPTCSPHVPHNATLQMHDLTPLRLCLLYVEMPHTQLITPQNVLTPPSPPLFPPTPPLPPPSTFTRRPQAPRWTYHTM